MGKLEILRTDFGGIVIRFICAVILHIQIESEVRQAISMIKYYVNHIT